MSDHDSLPLGEGRLCFTVSPTLLLSAPPDINVKRCRPKKDHLARFLILHVPLLNRLYTIVSAVFEVIGDCRSYKSYPDIWAKESLWQPNSSINEFNW